jgi:hypothetical protein
VKTMKVDGKLCHSAATDLAHRSIADQEAASPHRLVSLHAMWRACGEPARKSPDQWVQMARNLIDGIADYLEQTYLAFINGPHAPYVRWPAVDKPINPARFRKIAADRAFPAPYYRPRDITACPEVAVLYAMFLDNRGKFEYFVPEDDGGDEDGPDLAVFDGD